jgi:FtsP/CotA-like multicopper oxidase with cupredoxin domain
MAIDINSIDPSEGSPVLVPFWVIGADQGMGNPIQQEMLLIGPAQRFDIIIDFSPHSGQRIIMKNSGGDEPFGGDIPGPQLFELTDRVMAFDVVQGLDESVPDDWTPPAAVETRAQQDLIPDNVRRIGLFEGHDQYGRLQPLLGTIDPATDIDGNPICYPDTPEYRDAGLVGQMIGTQPWHAPTTENIKLNDVEDWEIWNLSADAHPIHLHLVSFILIKREYIKFESTAVNGEVEPEELGNIAGDGTYITDKPMVQHDGSRGEGYIVVNPTKDLERGEVPPSEYKYYADGFPKDTIIALPGQVTTIRAKFDKPGRFNHHCHIL